MIVDTRRVEEVENVILLDIKQAFDQSRGVLDWQDNWDGEGSSAYTEATWNRTRAFLIQNAMQAWQEHQIHIATPRILPGPNGSIDIHWRTDRRELLVNIPVDAAKPATYYGESNRDDIVEGSLDIPAEIQRLLKWLMK